MTYCLICVKVEKNTWRGGAGFLYLLLVMDCEIVSRETLDGEVGGAAGCFARNIKKKVQCFQSFDVSRETLRTDGGRSLALVGGNFRFLGCWLKRAMPTDACGRCPQKIKKGGF
ncbi:MAG: hypothetical protein MPK03_01555 [Alphaproteobacteria bacterium]|nr:hypothetical protein [Alphaproteobacteria bacterium]